MSGSRSGMSMTSVSPASATARATLPVLSPCRIRMSDRGDLMVIFLPDIGLRTQRLLVPGHPGSLEGERQPGGDRGVRMVHELEGEMRFAGVARVAALGDLLPGCDPLTLGDPDRA